MPRSSVKASVIALLGRFGTGNFNCSPATTAALDLPQVAHGFRVVELLSQQACCRFRNDNGDGTAFVFADNLAQGPLDSLASGLNRFSPGRAYGFRILLPLTIKPGLRLAQLFNALAVPQASIKVF